VNLRKHTDVLGDAGDTTSVAVNLAVLVALVLEEFMGWTRSDAVGALGISGYMLWNARGIVMHSLVQLLDRELDATDRDRIRTAILNCQGVRGVHYLRARRKSLSGLKRPTVVICIEIPGIPTSGYGGVGSESSISGASVSDRVADPRSLYFDH
jgi:Co/Zn/Cd efflux system component